MTLAATTSSLLCNGRACDSGDIECSGIACHPKASSSETSSNKAPITLEAQTAITRVLGNISDRTEDAHYGNPLLLSISLPKRDEGDSGTIKNSCEK